MKGLFIDWSPYSGRSKVLAAQLGIPLHVICYGRPGKLRQAPVRYTVQAAQTWKLLLKEKPDILFIANPPIVCVLLAFFYAQRYHAQYIIDSHTGAFLSRKWRWSLWLHRQLSQNALTTIVHNKSQEAIVKQWDCRHCVIAFIPCDYPAGIPFPLKESFNIAVISSFEADEPLDVVLHAAQQLPQVGFYVTGNSNHATPDLRGETQDNWHLTGYLPYEHYVGLLRSVDAILDLTTSDHTLLMGAFEAVALGKPLITSNWPILQDYFSMGTVHVSNTVEGLVGGIQQAQTEQESLKHGIVALEKQLTLEWEQAYRQLRQLMEKVQA